MKNINNGRFVPPIQQTIFRLSLNKSLEILIDRFKDGGHVSIFMNPVQASKMVTHNHNIEGRLLL
ncbi:hypothetical protein AN958_11647 [Leucoagaricus sp. SymC.cos]|nr:hypothetical protein AN958_11647 [Leucoagaricus sp. SymC.cos]